LKLGVPNGQHLINDQNIRLKMRGHGETKPHMHAAGVTFHGRVDEIIYSRKAHDLIELGTNLGLTHAHNGTIQKNILPAREFRMKARAHLKETGHPSSNTCMPGRRRGNAAQDLQERGFPGTVPSNDTQAFTAGHLEGDALQGTEALPVLAVPFENLGVRVFPPTNTGPPRLQVTLQCAVANDPQTVLLVEILYFNCVVRHLLVLQWTMRK